MTTTAAPTTVGGAIERHNNAASAAAPPQIRRASVLAVMASRFNVDPGKMNDLLKATVIRGRDGRPASDEEVAAFCIVANQYQLNPFTREIHAFADPQRGIVPIVGIDGWANIVNKQQAFDGVEFEELHEENDLGVRCTIYVKGRSHPVALTEWYSECKRPTPPWNTMRRRMLRHKAFMQCARIAFSISGIFDEDEARDIVEGEVVSARSEGPTAALNRQLEQPPRQAPPLETPRSGEGDSQIDPAVDQAAERSEEPAPADPQPQQPAPAAPAAAPTPTPVDAEAQAITDREALEQPWEAAMKVLRSEAQQHLGVTSRATFLGLLAKLAGFGITPQNSSVEDRIKLLAAIRTKRLNVQTGAIQS